MGFIKRATTSSSVKVSMKAYLCPGCGHMDNSSSRECPKCGDPMNEIDHTESKSEESTESKSEDSNS
jgi:rubrerythrin